MLVMRIMIAIMQSDDAIRTLGSSRHSNAALASDANGYGIHKNVGEYRDEERSRTGTCILVRKGLETEWNEVIPRGGSKVVPSNAKSWFIWGLLKIISSLILLGFLWVLSIFLASFLVVAAPSN